MLDHLTHRDHPPLSGPVDRTSRSAGSHVLVPNNLETGWGRSRGPIGEDWGDRIPEISEAAAAR